MTPSFFISFSTLNLDGPVYQPPDRFTDIAAIENYDDVIPGPNNSAIPRRSLSIVTTPALGAACLGVESFRLQDGSDIVIAGEATKLHRAYSTVTATFTFSDISKPGGYATAAGETWEMVSFRQGTSETVPLQRIIATNFTDHIQCIGIRANVSTTATFSDLISTGTKPKARHLGIIGQFLVLGNTDQATSTTAAYTPFRVHWSKFGDPSTFTPSAASQCDFEDLQTGGAVQKVVSGNEYGLLIQETQVQVMRYTGGVTIFDFSPVAYAPGTAIPTSVQAFGGNVYYISHEGFVALRGMELQRIGKDLVDRYLWDTLDQTQFHRVTSGIDPVNKIVWWGLPTDAAGFAKIMLGYKMDDGRWTRWTQSVERLGLIRQGQSSQKFIAFNTDHKLTTFTSNAYVTATFETNAIQPVPGRRWQCNGVQILAEGTGTLSTGQITARVYDTPIPTAQPSATAAVPFKADDTYIPLRTAGRFQRFTVSLNPGSASVVSYVGLRIDYEVLGAR